MQEIIIDIMNKFGYFGVSLLIAIENIFPPIPSEVILTFGGFMTKQPNSTLTIFGVVLAATIGSMLGALILYSLGKILNKERLIKIVSGKLGKILRLKVKDIEQADHWFDTKGNKTVFFCRFIPIVRSLISIPAGMSEMNMSKFLIYTLAGSIIWNTILVVIGSIVGQNWEVVANIVNQYANVVLILLILLFIIGVGYFYKSRILNQKR